MPYIRSILEVAVDVSGRANARALALLNGARDVLHVSVPHRAVEAVVDVLVKEAIDLCEGVRADSRRDVRAEVIRPLPVDERGEEE